ncbi:Uncharacterized protein TCM_031630 [Theobroma cacao]|uniref:Uncharacterized protein n=1 Tax=Theobroma cacao TaxID=3641 RepID=A0A061F7V0_THECC|nr:Uncharacterized protein TCM_031630 [Theobroma cacao]
MMLKIILLDSMIKLRNWSRSLLMRPEGITKLFAYVEWVVWGRLLLLKRSTITAWLEVILITWFGCMSLSIAKGEKSGKTFSVVLRLWTRTRPRGRERKI